MSRKDYTKFSNQNEKKEESIIETVVEETHAVEKHGVVVDCFRLNVRSAPSIDAEVVCEIDCSTDMLVYEEESTDEFYKICTSSGVEGFCMKKYISIRIVDTDDENSQLMK